MNSSRVSSRPSPRVWSSASKVPIPAPPSELFNAAYYNVHRKTEGQEAEGDAIPTPTHLQALQAGRNQGDLSVPGKDPLSKKLEISRMETASAIAKQYSQLKAIKSRPVVSGRGGVPNLAKMGWADPGHSTVMDVGTMTPTSNKTYASSSSSSVMSFRSS